MLASRNSFSDSSSDFSSRSLPYDDVLMIGMELEFYNAAMQGNIDAFEGMGNEQIECILTPNKNTILHVHITNYHDKVSETFVAQVIAWCPSLILKTNVKRETVLHIAARYGHYKIVKLLIDCVKSLPKDVNEVGAEKGLIRAMNDKENTALHEAALYGHNEVVDVLIKEEPDHTHFGKNVNNETPLYIAVERQHWNVVDTILNNSDSPQYNGPYRRTALHAAVLHLDEEKVLKLLTRNLSATKEADENGLVPLHLATIVGNSKMVELLLRNDRSAAYMKDHKGRTALHFAARCKDSSVMKKIIEYCPDCIELVDNNGSNALHYTTMGDSYLPPFELKQIVQDLAQISYLCNETDYDGNTPLHLLVRHASKNDDLLDHPLLQPQYPRLDTMAYDKYGQTVLDIADENKLSIKLKDIGARLGGRVLDKQLRGNKPEKTDDSSSDDSSSDDSSPDDSSSDDSSPDDSSSDDSSSEETMMRSELNRKTSLAEITTTLSVVAILIATVTFTAGFTLPGGLIQDGEHRGSPILKYNAAFIAFVITDSLSFVISTSTVLAIFLSSMVPQKEDKNRQVYKSLLKKCVYSTLVALGFMIVAFGMGMYSVLGVAKGFGVLALLIILSFFIIFIITFRGTGTFVAQVFRPTQIVIR